MAPDPPRKLYLIDGNSLVYRAFFALPESIATSRGQPTNAIFGFASMLVKLLTEHGQMPTIVVWDAGASGRKEVYAEYKAGRESRPDLLREQWPHLAPLVEAFGYRNVSEDGYEADDVIATIARRARDAGSEVTIVTGDRDAFQLVEDGVRVMATGRGITDTTVYDRQAVIDRYGIPPELIPDFYGLKGDTSDSIPGVPGIGDKTAAQLLQRFGDLDGVLANVDEVSGAKRKQNLIDHAGDARVSKQLATAIRDVPIDDLDLDLDRVLAGEPDRARLREVFREFELRDPLRRLEEALGEGDAAAPATPAAERLAVRARVVAPAALAGLEGEHAALWAERPPEPEDQLPGIEDAGPLAFGAYAGGDALGGESATLAEVVSAWGDRPLTAHDWKSLAVSEEPIASWASAGDPPEAVPAPPLEHDTAIAAYLLDPARRGYPLDELADDLGLEVAVEGEAGPDTPAGHAAGRAALVRALAERQRALLDEQGLTRLLTEVELPLVEVLAAMERAGVRLDVERVREIAARVGAEALALERRIWDLAGEEFMIGSPQQLAEVLFERLGLSRKRRGKTGFSTDARVLAAIRDEHEIVGLIEEWRELTKLKSTYLDAFPDLLGPDGRLRTTFNQTTAATGRLSSTNPNLQNIPIRTERGREIRACFVAEDGCRLISADYSQVELRLLAHIADEEVLRQIFRAGEDVHTATAAWILGEPGAEVDPGTRSKAKMVNYGIVYGLSAFGLADRLQIPQSEAQEFIDRYLERFPAVRAFIEATVARATDDGCVKTELGRIRRIPELRARNRQTRMLGERLAVNMVIQGTAADIMKVAMVRCTAALSAAGLRTRAVLQIHDELLFEAPEDEVDRATEIVRAELAGAFDMDPPLEVDVASGRNWLEAK